MAGFYGNFCDIKCSNDCLNSSCDRVHGNCLQGCKAGNNSTKCEKSLELLNEDDNSMSIVIGASIGGGVLVMFVILLLLIRKRRSGKDQNDNDKRGVTTENETMTYSEINDVNTTGDNNHTDVNEIDVENITRSAISDSDMSVNGRGTDAVYAKPIKPKEKSEDVKSLNRNSTKLTVDNTTYEKQETSKTVNKVPIASQPIHTFDINVTPNSTALQPTSHTVCATLASVSLNENKQKEATLDGEDTYYNEAAVKKRKTNLDQLPEFVSKKTEKDFVEEFQSLPVKLIKPYVDSQKRANLSKNRYKGIYPYDDTRVVLHDGESDYINASYIHARI
ncbi:tyrosine-protein phosphatase non-receptor type 20-like [Ruditapes philippinarum]|uniref:tyrosine-protein phosphatase non-receptor type 20-like n=1 Tax=Ruditapes philippinarum TaxID=129788 RepID=UPI00295B4594|nr:tyrosine-protein phosphatase non-receptor type 20-like [Ruditapes philippinarum]